MTGRAPHRGRTAAPVSGLLFDEIANAIPYLVSCVLWQVLDRRALLVRIGQCAHGSYFRPVLIRLMDSRNLGAEFPRHRSPNGADVTTVERSKVMAVVALRALFRAIDLPSTIVDEIHLCSASAAARLDMGNRSSQSNSKMSRCGLCSTIAVWRLARARMLSLGARGRPWLAERGLRSHLGRARSRVIQKWVQNPLGRAILAGDNPGRSRTVESRGARKLYDLTAIRSPVRRRSRRTEVPTWVHSPKGVNHAQPSEPERRVALRQRPADGKIRPYCPRRSRGFLA